MKIAILGAGHVGGALGKKWAAKGHEIVYASRNPESVEMQKLCGETGAGARAATAAAAVADAEVVLVATPWSATLDLLRTIPDWKGKTLIDATNPLNAAYDGLEFPNTTSAAEAIATATGARVVKAFNTVGANIMTNPAFAEGPAMLPYCGDDAAAKHTVAELIRQIGFDPVDVGPLRQARLLEPLALLWISMAFSNFGREFAFRLVRR